MASFLLFVIIFGVVVISHEFGHFIVARINGIRVVEFSVGMGPVLLEKKGKETRYTLRLLPIGGACMFEGEDGLAVKEGEVSENSFLHASVWARIATVAAGPIFNFFLGIVVALIMVSMCHISLPVLTDVAENGPAYNAGLQKGDKILSLNKDRILLGDEILLFNRVNNGKPVHVTFLRNGEKMECDLIPEYDQASGGYLLGIYLGEGAQEEGIARFKYGFYEIRFCAKQVWQSLGLMVRGQVKKEEVSGPVGIAVNVVGKTYDAAKEYGWETILINMLNITMLLTINLGILNLLPIPALDGGRLVFLLVEAIRGKPIPPEKEGIVHFMGLVFFMILMVIVLFNDLQNIFGL